MLVFFHHPDCVIWFYLLGWNHFLSIKGEIFRRSCWKKNCWPFPVSTQRVFPGQLPGLPGSTRFFQPRNDFYQFNFDTLESGYSQFFFGFEVNLKGSSCVQLVAAVSSPGMPSLNKTLRKKLVIFDTLQRNLLDTQLEGPEGWKSWIFKEKDKIQPFWFLILWKVRMKATIRIKDRFGIYFWAHILFQSSQANLSQPESSDVLVGKKKTTRGFTIS